MEITFIPQDTIIQLPPDSALSAYLIECEGKVAKLMRIVSAQGTRIEAPEARIVENILYVTAKEDTLKYQLRFWNKHIKEVIKSSKVVPIRENYLNGWQ